MTNSEQLAKKIIKLCKEKWDNNVKHLLWWLGGTIGKQYDEEEQSITLLDNCKEWEEKPTCFNDV